MAGQGFYGKEPQLPLLIYADSPVPITSVDEIRTSDDSYYLPEKSIFKYLKNSGSDSMKVNGSITPVNFDFSLPLDWTIYSLIITIADSNFTALKFGGINTLANGVTLRIYESDGVTLVLDFHDTGGIKSNAEWVSLSGKNTLLDDFATTDLLKVCIDFTMGIKPMLMQNGRIIRVTVNDDLTSLDEFEAQVHGVIIGV